jgi:hypothetical protein
MLSVTNKPIVLNVDLLIVTKLSVIMLFVVALPVSYKVVFYQFYPVTALPIGQYKIDTYARKQLS